MAFGTPDDVGGYLIWEEVYNGGAVGTAVPTDTWVSENLTGQNFWMRQFTPGTTIEDYDVTLAQWTAGYAGGPGQTHILDASTRIVAIEVGIGSGWGGSFKGAVDNVRIGFGGTTREWDFDGARAPVVDRVTDFETGVDKLDLRGVLVGYDPAGPALGSFVRASTGASGDTTVQVDADGAGTAYGFQDVVVLSRATVNLATDLILA